MQTTGLTRGTKIDTSDSNFTEAEYCKAANGPKGDNSLAVICNLYWGRGLALRSYLDATDEVKARVKAALSGAVLRYRGIYCLVSPHGNVGRRLYRGLAAAETGVWFSGGRSQIVLLRGGVHNTYPDAAARNNNPAKDKVAPPALGETPLKLSGVFHCKLEALERPQKTRQYSIMSIGLCFIDGGLTMKRTVEFGDATLALPPKENILDETIFRTPNKLGKISAVSSEITIFVERIHLIAGLALGQLIIRSTDGSMVQLQGYHVDDQGTCTTIADITINPSRSRDESIEAPIGNHLTKFEWAHVVTTGKNLDLTRQGGSDGSGVHTHLEEIASIAVTSVPDKLGTAFDEAV